MARFLSHSAKKFRKGILLFLRKLVSKSFMHNLSRLSVENFWSHSAEKFRRHPFNVSENLGVTKNFMHNRGYHVFPSNFFCLTVPTFDFAEMKRLSAIDVACNFLTETQVADDRSAFFGKLVKRER